MIRAFSCHTSRGRIRVPDFDHDFDQLRTRARKQAVEVCVRALTCHRCAEHE